MPEDRGPGRDKGWGTDSSLSLWWPSCDLHGVCHHPHSQDALRDPKESMPTRFPSPQSGPIVSRDTGRCLEVEMSKDANFGLRLVVQRCSGQKWTIRNWIKHGRH